MMRNILITIMMLIVVAVLFTTLIADDTDGIQAKIKVRGDNASQKISDLETN